jgi:hypothetical protein
MILILYQIYRYFAGILGMVSGVQLESLCLRSTIQPRASQPDVHIGYITPAPRVSVSHLVISNIYIHEHIYLFIYIYVYI